jgi:hypothetical protein
MQKSKKLAILRRTIALMIALCMFFSPSLGFLGGGGGSLRIRDCAGNTG